MNMDGRAVANFVLDVCEAEQRPITNLALQKIIYFCHVWSLVKLGQPLIKQRFEAWQFGPVLQYLYREFKAFERDPITSRAKKVNVVTGVLEIADYQFDNDTEQFLRKIIMVYSSISAGNLVDISHAKGAPWDLAWNHGGKVNPGMAIENDAIVRYYSSGRASLSPNEVG
ncbi:MAG TPA: type II toxin-antitoxin system antitoxin SocA domain-containing protein [Rhodanobacter sp.]|jgi:uncharacterized phage-associated protein|nr:type II toxin-antitoxin system antitoxin SocA domain-containing protein [Rhodanobacter sp.]